MADRTPERKASALRLTAGSVAFAAVTLVAAPVFAPPAFATVGGAARLAANETTQVSISPGYRWLRVCNDTSSAGTVTVNIGDQAGRILLPGWCAQNPGGSLAIKNDKAGPAFVTYRSILPNTGY